jgi:hypothetical protein
MIDNLLIKCSKVAPFVGIHPLCIGNLKANMIPWRNSNYSPIRKTTYLKYRQMHETLKKIFHYIELI